MSMVQTAQIIDFTYGNKRHWFKVWRFETMPEIHAALLKDGIREFPKNTVAYTDCYEKGEECGRMYLLDKSVDTLAHESTHMASGILARVGHKSFELTFENAPPLEEDFCQLVGHITSELYSKSKFY